MATVEAEAQCKEMVTKAVCVCFAKWLAAVDSQTLCTSLRNDFAAVSNRMWNMSTQFTVCCFSTFMCVSMALLATVRGVFVITIYVSESDFISSLTACGDKRVGKLFMDSYTIV